MFGFKRKEMPMIDGSYAGAQFVQPQTTQKPYGKGNGATSWYEALAQAWGAVLDKKAGEVVAVSNDIGSNGLNNPSAMLKASALAQEFGFLSSQSATATNSVGDGLQTVSKRG
jgi:hypothetical protein